MVLLTAEYLARRPKHEPVPPPRLPPPPAREERYEYRIQAADILSISVPSLVTLNTPLAPTVVGDSQEGYTVYRDGTIYLPYAGPIQVAGLTPREAQDRITQALSRFLRTPEVVVSVREFRSQRVMVTGQVEQPGYLPITDVPLTVLDALAATGGIAEPRGRQDPRSVAGGPALGPEYPDLRQVRLHRGDANYRIDVQRALATGDLTGDVVLQGGDVLVVPPMRRANIAVMGEVLRPALLEITPQESSLADVLMASGGLNPLTANARRVYVVRGEAARPTVYQLDARSPESLLLAQAFPIEPLDVVYVSEAAVVRWNRLLSAILPTVQGLLSTAVIVNTVDTLDNSR